MTSEASETLESFRKSFSYGSRNDLLFKFLGTDNITDAEAGEFFRELLVRLGEAFDSGDYGRVLEHCFNWQVRAYTPRRGAQPAFKYDAGPWTPLTKPLSKSRLLLISTGGIYVEGEDPLGPDGPTQEEAAARIQEFLRSAPTLSVIPKSVSPQRIRVRHPGYDIRGAVKDYNVVFPLDRLKELEAEGFIGELTEECYSFVGATSQKRLLNETLPRWLDIFKQQKPDAALLVAA